MSAQDGVKTAGAVSIIPQFLCRFEVVFVLEFQHIYYCGFAKMRIGGGYFSKE
jgi:hypothetical protein